MATPRSFDYDAAWRIIRQHPDWPLRRVAAAVTEHMRETTGDPDFPLIMPSAIASMKSRYRDTQEMRGITLPLLPRASTARTQPWANIPSGYKDDVHIQYLRTLHRISLGEDNIPPAKRRGAENCAARLRENKEVIDLASRPIGKPYIRAARPDELDGEGNIIQYHARHPGLTDLEWKRLGTPERRADASMRFTRDYEGPRPGAELPAN